MRPAPSSSPERDTCDLCIDYLHDRFAAKRLLPNLSDRLTGQWVESIVNCDLKTRNVGFVWVPSRRFEFRGLPRMSLGRRPRVLRRIGHRRTASTRFWRTAMWVCAIRGTSYLAAGWTHAGETSGRPPGREEAGGARAVWDEASVRRVARNAVRGACGRRLQDRSASCILIRKRTGLQGSSAGAAIRRPVAAPDRGDGPVERQVEEVVDIGAEQVRIRSWQRLVALERRDVAVPDATSRVFADPSHVRTSAQYPRGY